MNAFFEDLVTSISEEDWKEQVEIIGWLYQYYISEKKDEVFADLKKKELQSTTKHKQIAQVQIKRIMARTPNIKDPLKYEQKLTQKYLQGTLNFDKDLQIVNQELNKKIFDSI